MTWKNFLPALATLLLWAQLSAITLSEAEAQQTGRRIWNNECSGSVAGLTSWNAGEEFPSLGIGHFIWYPQGYRGPFEETFPAMIGYLRQQGVTVPSWLREQEGCPWLRRQDFLADLSGAQLAELRRLLAATVAHQARFIAHRLESALPKLLAQVAVGERTRLQQRFERVANSPGGVYALVDYVNFKGEGLNPKERYAGQGWGLLQVLQTMQDQGAPLGDFVAAADRVLTRRVENSPPLRGEGRWLVGWRNRLQTYLP